jgi:hypothetical protein
MNRYDLILAAIAATVVAGCATAPSPQTAATESADDKAYVTGSRLPVRDNSTSANVKGITDKRSIDDMVRPSGYISPKGN